MSPELFVDRSLAIELHGVLSEIDPARFRTESADRLQQRLKALAGKLDQRERMKAMSAALNAGLLDLEAPKTDLKARWMAFKLRLQPVYESMAASLRAAQVSVPSLRPTNYTRNLFHLAAAAVSMGIVVLAPTPLVVLLCAVSWGTVCWTLELSRQFSATWNTRLMGFFKPVAHPHEAIRVNSATWFSTSLVLLAATQSRPLCILALTVLGVGDPIAAIIGKRFGRTKLLHGRSLEGSLAFLVSGWVTALALLLAFSGYGFASAAVLALVGALAGAIAELVSTRIDDNLSIPLSVAAAGAATAWLLHYPL